MTKEPIFVLIDEPSPYDSLETWERHLIELKELPDEVILKSQMIDHAEEMIARKRRE